MTSSNSQKKPKILCVDDEPNVLEGLSLNLHSEWDVTTALSGQAGIKLLEKAGPFKVVISDLRMPGMDGIEFLREVSLHSPDSMRILLTGNADLNAAIEAVNESQIYKFLTKPTAANELRAVLHEALEKYNLAKVEQEILETTLQGSIKTLIDILAMTSPVVFGASARTHRYVREICDELSLKDRWPVETAALLSNIGAVFLDEDVVNRYFGSGNLTDAEQQMIQKIPRLSGGFLARIPRMGLLIDIIEGKITESHTPMERLYDQIYRIASDYSLLRSRGAEANVAIDVLRSREGNYHARVLNRFSARILGEYESQRVVEMPLSAVKVGMEFCSDVNDTNGVLLIAKGQMVTEVMIDYFRGRGKGFNQQLVHVQCQ